MFLMYLLWLLFLKYLIRWCLSLFAFVIFLLFSFTKSNLLHFNSVTIFQINIIMMQYSRRYSRKSLTDPAVDYYLKKFFFALFLSDRKDALGVAVKFPRNTNGNLN